MSEVAIHYGPQDVCPAAWQRVLDQGHSGLEALIEWMELVGPMTEHLGLMEEIDGVVAAYEGELKKVTYSDKGASRTKGGGKEDAIVARFMPYLFALGLDPHQVANAMRIPLRRLAAILSCNGAHNAERNTKKVRPYEPAIALLAYDLLVQGKKQTAVARQLGLEHTQVKRLAEIYHLRLHDKPRPTVPEGVYQDGVRECEPDLRLLQQPTFGASLYSQSVRMNYSGN